MSSARKASTAYVWFDTEFTSLDLDEARLLQVSAMLTDKDLKRLTPPEDDLNLYVKIDAEVPLSDWVKTHLPQLVQTCQSEAAVPVEQIDGMLTAWVDRWCKTPLKTIQKRPLMAGNSVHNDWVLARRFFPTFVGRLHYRLLDVSAFKVQWFDQVGGPEFDKESAEEIQLYFPEADLGRLRQHDAYYDIVASAAELAYYRAHTTYRAPCEAAGSGK